MTGLFDYFAEDYLPEGHADKGYGKVCGDTYSHVVFHSVVKVCDVGPRILGRTQKQVETHYGKPVAEEERGKHIAVVHISLAGGKP